jgi:hypothetical protein
MPSTDDVLRRVETFSDASGILPDDDDLRPDAEPAAAVPPTLWRTRAAPAPAPGVAEECKEEEVLEADAAGREDRDPRRESWPPPPPPPREVRPEDCCASFFRFHSSSCLRRSDAASRAGGGAIIGIDQRSPSSFFFVVFCLSRTAHLSPRSSPAPAWVVLKVFLAWEVFQTLSRLFSVKCARRRQ